jgi:hypothetical protein
VLRDIQMILDETNNPLNRTFVCHTWFRTSVSTLNIHLCGPKAALFSGELADTFYLETPSIFLETQYILRYHHTIDVWNESP